MTSQSETVKDLEASPQPSFSKRISNLARKISRSDAGSLASLRRGPLNGPGVAAFWKLMAENGELSKEKMKDWAAIVQCVAILSPRATQQDRPDAHNPGVPFGSTLFKAGISEIRLARLLTATRTARRTLLPRVCRRLANGEHCRFNITDLALLVLSNDPKHERRIAQHYYRALSAQQKSDSESET